MGKPSKARDQSTPRGSKPLGGEITKLEEQIGKELGDLELAESPDEAAQIGVLRATEERFGKAQARVQQCRFAIKALTEKIANNERLREEVAQHKAEKLCTATLGSG